ncbi:hypothetical protein GQ457_18G004620 [Hibiscus cannabinus]
MGSLQSHEARLNRSEEKAEDKAFHVKGEALPQENEQKWRGQVGSRGRGGRGRGRGRGDGHQNQTQQRDIKKYIQCFYCKKFGHVKADCWKRPRQEQASYVEQEDGEIKLFMAYQENAASHSNIWFLDSGCSNHMTGVKSMFNEIDETFKQKVTLGDNKQIQVEGKGNVAVKSSSGNVKLLYDVYYIHSLSQNLSSVGQLMATGYSIMFGDASCVIKDKKNLDQTIVDVRITPNKLFPLVISEVENHALAVKETSESRLWHLRYGHLNIKGLKLLCQKEMVFGLPRIESLDTCEGCIYGKQCKKSFPVGKARRATRYLELVHTDVVGPMKTQSFGGSRYFLLFTDDCSRMSWVYFLQFKSETFENFKKFKALVEKQTGRCIKALLTDRGDEFVSQEFNNFCDEQGLRRELTAPYTPEQNGVAERKNRTVVEMERSMLRAKGLPNQLWAEAVATAVYLLNLSPTRAVLNQTPYEAWLFSPCDSKIIISRNVTFNEDARWTWEERVGDVKFELASEETAPQTEVLQPPSPNPSLPPTSPSSSGSSSDDETPPRRFKSLDEIYATTQAFHRLFSFFFSPNSILIRTPTAAPPIFGRRSTAADHLGSALGVHQNDPPSVPTVAPSLVVASRPPFERNRQGKFRPHPPAAAVSGVYCCNRGHSWTPRPTPVLDLVAVHATAHPNAGKHLWLREQFTSPVAPPSLSPSGDHSCQIYPPTRSTPTPTTRVAGSSVAGSSGTIDRAQKFLGSKGLLRRDRSKVYIVYDYMPNLSLLSHLHGQFAGDVQLDWKKRMKIAVGSAEGILYLHHEVTPHIIHRDIKASNVLLDSNFEPLVADFGFAKLIPEGVSHMITRVKGTLGYLAPEYAMCGKGRKPIDKLPGGVKRTISEWTEPFIAEGRFKELVDPKLRGYFGENQLKQAIYVAALCVHNEPEKRPNMKEVAGMLKGYASRGNLMKTRMDTVKYKEELLALDDGDDLEESCGVFGAITTPNTQDPYNFYGNRKITKRV